MYRQAGRFSMLLKFDLQLAVRYWFIVVVQTVSMYISGTISKHTNSTNRCPTQTNTIVFRTYKYSIALCEMFSKPFTCILYSLFTFILFHSLSFIHFHSLFSIHFHSLSFIHFHSLFTESNQQREWTFVSLLLYPCCCIPVVVSLLLILEICGNNSYNLYTFTLLFSDQPGGIHYHKSPKIGNIRKSHCWDWRAVSNWLGDSGMDHSECHSRIPHTDELTHKVAVWV